MRMGKRNENGRRPDGWNVFVVVLILGGVGVLFVGVEGQQQQQQQQQQGRCSSEEHEPLIIDEELEALESHIALLFGEEPTVEAEGEDQDKDKATDRELHIEEAFEEINKELHDLIVEGVQKYAAQQQLKYPQHFIDKLKDTHAVNLEEIISDLKLPWRFPPQTPLSYKLQNPYWFPRKKSNQKWRASEPVLDWYVTYETNKSVCAIQWLDDREKKAYRLKTWPSREIAEKKGYIVTHDKACGSCSSLSDLAIYLGTLDLTQPTRTCSRKPVTTMMKKCLIESIGFTPTCAEAWSYNIGNTRLFCTLTCIKDYGLSNVVLNKLSQFPDNLPDGELRPCIECDEQTSGAGFKYGSGRTRRNSGIQSNIQRDPGEVSHIDHYAYFRDSI